MTSKHRFYIVYLLIAATALYLSFHSDVAVPLNRPLDEFPKNICNWRMVSQEQFSEQILHTLKPTDYLSRIYEGSGGRTVQLYIGYSDGVEGGGDIHSPKHCLPGNGWYEDSSKRIQLDINGKKIGMVKAVYQKGDVKELFYYWFQVHGRAFSDEYSLKLAQIGNSILHQRRDAAFVRIAVPVDMDEGQSSASGMRFMRDFYPAIMDSLPS